MKFAGRIIWITGASSGIGEALAYAFAREGARLVLSSRRSDELERVRAKCERPAEHAVVPLDLARSETFDAAVASVLARHGRIDVLVNNGGVGQRALAIDMTLEMERRLMEVDYFGTVALTKAMLPSMRANRAGHVVVVSSVMGYVGVPGRSTYAAAKHALHGYFDSLRTEIWRDGIKVTLACPGYVKTAISANAVRPHGARTPQTGETHRTAITAEKCASAIVRGVARGREEIYIGRLGVAGIYLKRFVPRFYSSLVRRMTFPVTRTQ